MRRVRDLLRAEVLNGTFGGGALPSELCLVAQYGVSRGVVREVLDLLRHEGLIQRLQGAGTFVVAPTPAPHGIEVQRPFQETIDRGPSRTTWEPLDVRTLQAPPLVARRLQVEEGADVVYLERLTILDGRPLVQRTSWFPFDLGEPLLRPDADLRSSIYEVIERQLGVAAVSTELSVQATAADHATAPILDVAPGTPLLLMERLVRASDGRPVELSFGRARSDRMVLTTVMHRPVPPSPHLPSAATADAGRPAGGTAWLQ